MEGPGRSGIDFTEPFGSVLRRLRKHRGMRQIELAVELPVDHSLISRWETGSVLPTAKDVATAAAVLRLDDAEAEELHYAWRRARSTSESGEFADQVPRLAEDWVDSLRVSVACVRALRKSGQPRTALTLSRRDAGAAFDRLRARSWTDAYPQALTELSELLLEECKAALDYVPGTAVRKGELSRVLAVQGQVARSAGLPSAVLFHDLAREAVSYVAGNIGEAHELSLSLLADTGEMPADWVPEVVRACAINAGKLADRDTLHRTDDALGRLLDSRDDLPPGTHAFVLEGISRGWAGVDPRLAVEVVERAWSVRERSGDSESNSALRYVQLVRSQAEVELALRAATNLADTLAKIENALEVSRREGYDKYVIQLQDLGDRLG